MTLFGKKEKESKPERRDTGLAQKETTYFGKNLKIKGRVSGNGNVIILGSLDGEFNLKGRVKIAQPAKIKGEVKADVISVNGNVRGSLVAQERVHMILSYLQRQFQRLLNRDGTAFDTVCQRISPNQLQNEKVCAV